MDGNGKVLFRDLKVADDVKKMMDMRYFQQEYTMYGCLFREENEQKYIISANIDKIIDFVNNRENYDKYPLPIIKHSLSTTVPAGNEEEIVRLAKIELAKIIRSNYSKGFLQDFFELASQENDDQAEPILSELQEKMYGLFRSDNLVLFENLMNVAYRGKHLRNATKSIYEEWLEDEWRQMEEYTEIDSFFNKKLYGIAYLKNGNIATYCNGIKKKAFEKQEQLEAEGGIVSQINKKIYPCYSEKNLYEIKKEYQIELVNLFDAQYFDYLKKILQIEPAIEVSDFEKFEEKYSQGTLEEKRAIEQYARWWRV